MRSSIRESWLIAPITAEDRAAVQPWNGRARPDDPDRQMWNRVVAKRRYEYKPLDDAVYHARFRTLCFRWHPAVAAILAHDVSNGPGCYNTRVKRR